MALKCYPLQPGGLLAIQAVIIGMTTRRTRSTTKSEHNLPVILLLMFMVAGIFFLKEMLLFTFTKILLGCPLQGAALAPVLQRGGSSFRFSRCSDGDSGGDHRRGRVSTPIYHKVASGKGYDHSHDCIGRSSRWRRCTGRTSRTVPRLSPQPDDACGRRYGPGRCHDAGRASRRTC